MQLPIQILEQYWKYTAFRPLQEDIINAVLDNEDTFVLMPTGGGKSLCFQIPALLKDGICIVISPLIALMKDQVSALKSKGIKAIALTSGISQNDLDTLLDNCIYGNYKFLYLSPERLQQTIVQNRIQQMNVNLIAVDEAHCISQWGNDFRPAYNAITILRQWHPHTNIIALTATAKKAVITDIIENLDFISPKLFKASFYRPNISYQVIHSDDKLYRLERLLQQYNGPSIVYVRNRKATKQICAYLESKGFSSTFYHGGITNKEKQQHQLAWTNNQKQVIVATTAFGMGIDKPDVKTVIHYHLPESLESYYQEAGRAGRNGEKAYAIILKQHIDTDQLKQQFIGTLPSIDFVKHIYNKLCNYFQISYGEGEHSAHQLNFKAFCNTYNLNSTLTYNSLKLLDLNSIITLNQQFNYKTQIQFVVSSAQVFNYIDLNPSMNFVIKALLRSYGGIFDHPTKVNIDFIANKCDQSEHQIIKSLKTLEADHIITLALANTDAEVVFVKPREDEKTINPIAKTIKQQQQLKKEQVKAVIDYIENDKTCRTVQLLNYFGEANNTNCGKCDACLSKSVNTKASELNRITTYILNQLKVKDLSSRALLDNCNYSEQELIKGLEHLLALDKIDITPTNTYKIK